MPFFGISPKLPIIHDDVSPGFDVTKTINEAAQQNLKHLILNLYKMHISMMQIKQSGPMQPI